MMEEHKTAIHEAGHAVGHIRLEILQGLLTIIPNGSYAGADLSVGIDAVEDAEKAERMVLAYCAGFAASMAAGYEVEHALVGCDDDFEKCSKLIKDWELGYSLEQFKGRAVELMSKPRNLSAVRIVADYALLNKRVEGDVIDALVELAYGHCTHAEFKRYLAFRC